MEVEKDTVKRITDVDALMHLLKGSLGSGILAMPLAFANAGLGFGLVCTFITGLVCTYCIHILVKSAHELGKRLDIRTMSFAEVAETAFSSGPKPFKKFAFTAKFMINFFLCLDLLGCCCVYIIFITSNLKQVVDHYTDSDYDLRIYIAVLLPVLILMNIIRTLKVLAPFSMVANIFVAIGMGITFYYIFSDLPAMSERPHFVEWHKLPMFFGTAIFALEGIGVVMPLENKMKTPAHFIGCPSVLNIGMSFVVTLYAAVGFFGYWRYGPETQGSITLNLEETEILAQSVKVMIAVAIFFTYSLQFYVPMEIIWKSVENKFTTRKLCAEYTIRITLVILTDVTAILVPNLGGVISLVGAVCLSFLGMIFPALIDLVTFYDEPGLGRFKWRLWKNLSLVAFGLLGFTTGTYVSSKEIIDTYSFF